MDHSKDGLQLISDIIRNSLKIDMSVLMGANIASEVADEKFCETTIGNYIFTFVFQTSKYVLLFLRYMKLLIIILFL